MGRSSSSSPPLPKNPGTIALPAFGGVVPVGSPMSARDAWTLATATDAARPRRCAHGYRVYAVDKDGVVGRDLPDEKDAFLVLGRHQRCDLVLEGDPTVSLRHLLLRLQPADGVPALRILDLRTQTGFCLLDESLRRSALVKGPVLFRVGPTWIAALTSDAAAFAEPPASVYELGKHPYREAPAGQPAPVSMRPPHLSRVTLLPPPCALGEPPPGSDVASEYVLELATADGVVRRGVHREQLERGYFVGRSDRCEDPRLRGLLPESISRVHLLLARVDHRVVAYDVASTQGTHRGHGPSGGGVHPERIRAAVLDDLGTELLLALQPRVVLRWYVRPSCAP